MQKLTLIVVIALLGFASAAIAQPDGGGMMPQKGMMQGMEKSIVASNDGGVIVLAGHKLYKYDKNLNLVKEVELPRPEGMMDKTGMMEKKGGCSCGGGACGAHGAAAQEQDHSKHQP